MRVATWVRAVHSKWQLREVLADFWHNHFNVNAEHDDGRIAAMFPAYDRDVIRKHALGNFRQFLEAVAQSRAMLAYLNNAASRASPANENFARELFELHTLGRDHYLNHLYNRWRDVPGAAEGRPAGYIDQDVYEAARAFTGWTIADGTDSEPRRHASPTPAQFHYYDGWHDNYQKRVLGAEFDPNQPPLADGRRVLDLVAFHPGTAPARLHEAVPPARGRCAAGPGGRGGATSGRPTATPPTRSPGRCARSCSRRNSPPPWPGRAKRPFEVVASFLRATGADLHADGTTCSTCRTGWARSCSPGRAPPATPNRAATGWGPAAMLGRFNAPLSLLGDDLKSATFRLSRETPAGARTPRQVYRYWAGRMLGQDLEKADPRAFAALLKYAAGDGGPDARTRRTCRWR